MSADPSFEKSLKPTAIEEFLDFYFYRRVAHRLVPFLIKLKLSPNQVTTISLLFGLTASYVTLHHHFTWGATLAFIAIFFDCCDGQVARLTGQTSPMGRVMDGVFDMIWITTLWLAIHFSGHFQSQGYDVFWLMFASAACVFLHCWKFDGIKIRYLELAEPGFSEKDLDFPQAVALIKGSLKKFDIPGALLACCMAFQMYFFVRGNQKKTVYQASPEQFQKNKSLLEPIIDNWSWLGEGHHNTVILLGLLMLPWTPWVLIAAFWIILVPMNIWFFMVLYRWNQALKNLKLS